MEPLRPDSERDAAIAGTPDPSGVQGPESGLPRGSGQQHLHDENLGALEEERAQFADEGGRGGAALAAGADGRPPHEAGGHDRRRQETPVGSAAAQKWQYFAEELAAHDANGRDAYALGGETAGADEWIEQEVERRMRDVRDATAKRDEDVLRLLEEERAITRARAAEHAQEKEALLLEKQRREARRAERKARLDQLRQDMIMRTPKQPPRPAADLIHKPKPKAKAAAGGGTPAAAPNPGGAFIARVSLSSGTASSSCRAEPEKVTKCSRRASTR